jgi:transcriptional regulator with XRE-family HTH domain
MSTVVSDPDVLTIHWPTVIRHVRLSKGLKQASLAHDLGVTQTMVSRWEAGNALPSSRIQAQIHDMIWALTSTLPRHTWMERARRNPSCVAVINSDGLVELASRGLLRCLKTVRGQVEGRNLRQAFRGDIPKLFKALVDRGFFQGKIATVESVERVVFTDFDGRDTQFWQHSLHRPVFVGHQSLCWLISGASVSRPIWREVRERLGSAMVVRKAI